MIENLWLKTDYFHTKPNYFIMNSESLFYNHYNQAKKNKKSTCKQNQLDDNGYIYALITLPPHQGGILFKIPALITREVKQVLNRIETNRKSENICQCLLMLVYGT